MLRSLYFVFSCVIAVVPVSGQDYNIRDYGAIADGRTLNTRSIQSAIDSAHVNGGGRVVVPPGRFLTASLVLKSAVELHLDEGAVLLGSTIPAHYLRLNRWKALILADGQEDIAITGPGEIDGQGRALALRIDSLYYAGQIDSAHYNFVEMRPKYYLRPQLIEFVNCRNIRVRNVTLRNAACWVQTYDLCDGLLIDSVHVDSDAYWNNDGIDISDCRNVRITNCVVNSADDGICLKSHSLTHLCDSVYIADCVIRSSASAIKLGTRSYGGFTNVMIKNIRVYDTFRSAVAIECVDGGVLENVLVDGIDAVNTGNAIFIRLGKRYRLGERNVLRNVILRNINVQVAFGRPDYDYQIRGPDLPFFHNTFPSSITGIPGHPVENVILENIVIRYPGRGNNGLANLPLWRLDDVPEQVEDYPEFSMFGELPAWGLYVRHVRGLTLRNVRLSIDAPDYRPPIVFDDVRDLHIESLEIPDAEDSTQIVLHNTENIRVDKHYPTRTLKP
jgi:hypothetical protein